MTLGNRLGCEKKFAHVSTLDPPGKTGLQGYQMSRFLMSLAARIPLAILHALGALLGWAMYGLSPTYRRHLRENLAAAGYRDAATRRAAIAGAGKMLAELPAVWLRP